MHKARKIFEAAKRNPAGLKFKDLCALVIALGYALERQNGSHCFYFHTVQASLPLINIQPGKNRTAKRYQVLQVLQVIDQFNLKVPS